MRINRSILWLITMLTMIGCISIYYAALYDSQNAKHMVTMQLIWLTLSVGVMVGVSRLTDEQLYRLAMPVLGLTLLLLGATLVLYNKQIYLQTGAKDWLSIAGLYRLALTQKNILLSYYVIGYIALLTFHIFENIGMNIGIMPLTGIPLPFISQGGSALLSNFICIGIILSLGKFKGHSIFSNPQIWQLNFFPKK